MEALALMEWGQEREEQAVSRAMRSRVVRQVLLWAPAAACAGLIQYGSVRTVVEFGPEGLPIPQGDKLVHAIAYALLAVLLARALRGSLRLGLSLAALAAIAASVAYGGLQEIIQSFLPNRSCDVFDLLANTAGAALAALLWHAVASRRSRAARQP